MINSKNAGLFTLFNNKKETNNPTPKPTNKLQFNYHRIPETAEVDKILWRSSCPNPQLKQGHLQPAAQDFVQTSFEYLWGWRFHSLSGWVVAMLGQPHSEKRVFWCSDRASCVSLCACCFLPCHWAHLKRAWLHLLYTFLVFILHLREISLNSPFFSTEFNFTEAVQQVPPKMMLYNICLSCLQKYLLG